MLLRETGAQETGTSRLEEAVSAYRSALKESTQEQVPLDRTSSQTLGITLTTLGSHVAGTTHLEEAVVAYRNALEETTRERYPRLWALTQENLGLALQVLGEREKSANRLEQAVAAIGGALEVFEKSDATYNIKKARRTLASAEAALTRLR